MEMKPGIYPDLSNDDYHSSNGISNTGISLLRKAPAFYYDRYIAGNKTIETESFKVGKLVHLLTFEPHLLFKNYTIIKDTLKLRKKTKEGDANRAMLEKIGLPWIKESELKEAKEQAIKIRLTKITEKMTFGDVIDRGGNSETSLYWESENGILLKARPDFYNDNIIIDLKTSVCADQYEFSCSIGKYGYHRQAYLQMEGLEKTDGKRRKHFINIVVEKKKPYLTAAYRLDELSIEKGKQEVLEALNTYQICKSNNVWPGYQAEVQEISLQRWYRS